MALKFENTAEVGDVIMAYDFPPNNPEMDDQYITGVVVEKGDVGSCHGYKVRVINSESGCDEFDVKRIGTEMVVPFEMMILEHDQRVKRL